MTHLTDVVPTQKDVEAYFSQISNGSHTVPGSKENLINALESLGYKRLANCFSIRFHTDGNTSIIEEKVDSRKGGGSASSLKVLE